MLTQVLLQLLQEYLIGAAVGDGGEVQQVPIFAPGEVGFALFFPGEGGRNQAQEGQPDLDERKQHYLLLSSEADDSIVGFDDSEDVAEGLRGVEIHSSAKDHELNNPIRVNQRAEVNHATYVLTLTLFLVYKKIRLA